MSQASRTEILEQLAKASRDIGKTHLTQLFAAQPDRMREFSLELPDLLFDYSRNRISREILDLLLKLADASGFAEWRQRLFAGEQINNTEQRAALHTLLRADQADVPAGLASRFQQIQVTRQRMREFSVAVRDAALRGTSGRPFTDVVHIGIGGSHLGPELVIEALTPISGVHPRVHFLSNVDPEQSARLLAALDPASTLVIVASKTFTTQETLANANVVRAWISAACGEASIASQFVAVTASPARAGEFGIPEERIFVFQDWVGGRYSLWSAIGLPISIALGPETFDALLEGAARMDRHFSDAPLAQNLPVVSALLGVWHVDFSGAQSRAVIPYRQSLRLLPVYLQQLEMESNGKGVQCDGEPLVVPTAPVTWGGVGTDAQHAFFQLLHQGTAKVPVEFIAVINEAGGNREQQDMLLANCFAQAEALMRGRSEAEARRELAASNIGGEQLSLLAQHKTFTGNRPSSLLLLDRLDAETLGMLIAYYEHRTFVQACVWNINPFDQMGVELGKQLAGNVLHSLENRSADPVSDPVTAALVRRVLARRD